MMMTPSRQAKVALVMLALIVLWQAVHMVWTSSRAHGWSPRRLMGFGMFVEPLHIRTHVGVVLLAKGEVDAFRSAGSASDADLAEFLKFKMWSQMYNAREPFDVSVFKDGRAQPIEVTKYLGRSPAGRAVVASAPGANYRRKVTDLQALYNRKPYIATLALAVKKAATEQGLTVDRAVVIVSKPRLDLFGRYFYADSCAFVYSDEGVDQVGCFKGNQISRASTIFRELDLSKL